MEDPAPAWDAALRPWRVASGIVGFVEVPLFAAVLAFVFLSNGTHRWAYLATGAVLALEVVKWVIDREALRRVGQIDVHRLYASAPLDRRGRRVVGMTLVVMPIAAVSMLLNAAAIREDDIAVGMLLVTVLAMTSFPMLLRVWRRNSWLAVTRIPSLPKRPLRRAA